MSTSYVLLCHTCEVKIDLSGYNKDFIQEFTGHCALYSHCGHNIQVLNDASLGWDEEYTRQYYNYDNAYTSITVQDDIRRDKEKRGRGIIPSDRVHTPSHVHAVIDETCWTIHSDGQSVGRKGKSTIYYNVLTEDCEGELSIEETEKIKAVYEQTWGKLKL